MFGAFQEFYSTTLIPTKSNSTISWIGSLGAFLLCTSSMLTGPLFDVGFGRPLVYAGSLFVVVGLMMTSLCSTFWQLILAQGVCIGIGAGALFIVSVAVLPGYFAKQRALAIGVAASGSSLGGVIYPIIFHRLQPRIGFGWATRVIGFIALATLLFACVFIKPRSKPDPSKRRKIIDISGFRELPFNLFCVASLTGFCGLYIPFFYISEFASRAGFPGRLAFYMLPILSAGSIVGRVVPGLLADRFGPLNVLAICTAISGLLAFCWIAISRSIAGLIIWALLYGCFSGAFVSLQPASIISITKDLSYAGGRLGTNTFFAALGLLIGTPVAGAIIGQAESWTGMRAFCGAMLLVSAVLVLSTRVAKTGFVLMRKA